MKLKRMVKEREGENGWSRWVRPVPRNYMMACCDCGLVHRMEFFVVKVAKRWKDGRWAGDVLSSRDYRVMFRAQRAPRYTAKQRRKRAASSD